ncbi:MAG: acyl-CoA thioesterase [Oscillospiraceae bacterium]|nr:acyl-CoA thioesterase [Oscillospiraceae bacterium]
MVYTYLRKAHYYETDQMGVVHHANYIHWMEEARIEMMDDMGFGYKKVEEIGIVSPVVSINIDYKSSVMYDDIVEVRVSVKRYTGVSMIISYEMFDQNTGKICATAESKHGFIRDGKIVSVKREVPELDEAIRKYVSNA